MGILGVVECREWNSILSSGLTGVKVILLIVCSRSK